MSGNMMEEVNCELDLIVKLKTPTNYPHARPPPASQTMKQEKVQI